MRRIVSFTIAFGLFSTVAAGGVGVLFGDEEGLWDEDRVSVVLARVTDVSHDGDGDGDHLYLDYVTLEPLGTLSGSFDAGTTSSVTARFWFGANSSLDDKPQVDTTVLVVIRRADDWWAVVSDFCQFMPGRSALVEVDGWDDPRVAETLKRIQAVRGAGAAGEGGGGQDGAAAEEDGQNEAE